MTTTPPRMRIRREGSDEHPDPGRAASAGGYLRERVMERIIFDLCGGTGSWSKPYVEAGYDVRIIDLPNDVRLIENPGMVHGVLAAPPCTYFCTMRQCRPKPTREQMLDALSIVDACLRIVIASRPRWWALENPSGSLRRYLGDPALRFQPWQFGDPWTKRTWIWGRFALPLFSRTTPLGKRVSSGKNCQKWNGKTSDDFTERAMTPPGFARAFFEANP